MEIPHKRVADGILINVRVIPRSSRTGIAGTADDALKVRLTAPPAEGAANRQLVEFLAEVFGVRKGDVEIVRGLSSRTKTVKIRTAGPG